MSRSLVRVLGTKLAGLVVLGHPSVASGLAIAYEQAVDLIQRLLVVASRLSTRIVFEAHEESPPYSGTRLLRTLRPCRRDLHCHRFENPSVDRVAAEAASTIG
jgi:hypothetical protein